MAEIDCIICGRELRQYNYSSKDNTYYFTCDTLWCPTDVVEVKITYKPHKLQGDIWLSI